MAPRAIAVGFILMAMGSISHAKTIHSLPERMLSVDICHISNTTILGRNEQTDVTVRAIEIYLGQSTDLSPRYRLLITYFNGGEMNNTRTAFDLGYFVEVTSCKRLRAGLYQIHGTRLIDNAAVKNFEITVNATQVFIDDRNIKSSEFQDPYFSSTIQVTEELTAPDQQVR
jgi:hypothetical protein